MAYRFELAILGPPIPYGAFTILNECKDNGHCPVRVGLHLRLVRSGGELSVTCAPDSDAGSEAPQDGNPSSEQPLHFVAPASGNIKPQPEL
jgi:hypothetical protein